MGHLVVSIGSTQFNELVCQVSSESFIENAKKNNFTRMSIQYGHGFKPKQSSHISITSFTFTDCLQNLVDSADLIISHAGAGTILDVLRGDTFSARESYLNKVLVVVPNTELMDNHQVELVETLRMNQLCYVSRVEDLNSIFEMIKEGTKCLEPSYCVDVEKAFL